MAQVTQPDYIEGNITPVQNSTRLVGQSVFVGMTGGVQLNSQLVTSPGTFVGIDGHRN